MAVIENSRMLFIVLMLISALLLLVISKSNPEIFITREPQFKEGDLIPLLANKVLPHADNCEAYSYYELPFCPPGDPIPNRKKTLEEITSGDCFTTTQYELKFKVETVGETLCEKTLTKDEVRKFRKAVSNRSEYHMYYNNILLRGMVGFVKAMDSRPRYYLVKHTDFHPQYYENQVVDINSLGDLDFAVDITEDAEIKVRFTYSVFWKDSIIKPTKSISQNGTVMMIQWWSSEGTLLNFLFLIVCLPPVMLLMPLVFPTTRSRCRPRDECQRPANTRLLATILGHGVQQLLMMGFSFLFVWYWDLHDVQYPRNLGPLTNLVLTYCSICWCYGFYDSSRGSELVNSTFSLQEDIFYLLLMFITALGLIVVAKLAFESVNWWITAIFFLVSRFLAAFAFRKGTQIAYDLQHRSRRPLNPRTRSWFMTIPAQMFIGGFFPFTAIFGKMDEIYASFLLLKLCSVLTTMLSSFLLVIIMTLLMGAGFTTCQLYFKHFNWWWRSVLRGGSTAIFMFAYGMYFYCRVTKEISFPDLSYFLIYNACLCSIFFVALGAVGFYASYLAFKFYDALMLMLHALIDLLKRNALVRLLKV